MRVSSSRWSVCQRRAICASRRRFHAPRICPGRALLRMGLAMVEYYCSSFRTVPNRIVLDIVDTFDTARGAQQLCLFNAQHDEYGYQPIVVFDGDGRMAAAVLRPACQPKGSQIAKWLRRLIDAFAAAGPAPPSCCAVMRTTACRRCCGSVGRIASISSWPSRRRQRCASQSTSSP